MERPTSRRSGPRISVSKLGEYLEASARRRENILRDQKFPTTYIVIRYSKARQAIRAALMADEDVPNTLAEFANAIEGMTPKHSQDADSIRLNADAVRRFAALHGKLGLKGTTPLLASPKGIALRSEGVLISVAPIVLLRRRRRDTGDQWGAIVGIFRKTEALGLRGGKAVAEIARLALTNAGYTNIRADLCVAVDVFSGQIFTASGRGTRVAGEIASACREIAARWSALAEKGAA